MNTWLKVGLWGAVLGGLLWIGKKSSEAIDAVGGITYRIVDFGIPKIANKILSVPLKLSIFNPTQTSLAADDVNISISILQKNNFVKVGGAKIPNVVIPPGNTEKGFIAQADLKALTSNLFDTLSTVFQNSAITIRADVQVTVKGVTLPSQTVTKSINV